jgi:tRNA A-37 threonylcarbamoyl transferase component Bud32
MKECFEEKLTKNTTDKKHIGLPFGIGEHKLRENRIELPVVNIDNEVLWVNEDMNLPFKIKKGEPTDVVGFFIQASEENKVNSFLKLEIHSEHQRTALIGRVIFRDKQGNLYRDIDQKGGGYIRNEVVENITISFANSGSFGICDLRRAATDKRLSEKFINYGIRTHRVVAIIKLKEIVDGTEKITIEEARRRNRFRSIENPVIEVRAYGTKMRIHDIYYDKKCDKFLKDAMYLVAQEKGVEPESFGIADYYNWFCVTLGEQVAKMHSNGYAHRYLTPHNITLDCRIVDLDSVINLRYEKIKDAVKGDKKEAVESLEKLFKAINRINKEKGLSAENLKLAKEKFDFGYNEMDFGLLNASARMNGIARQKS